MEDDRSQVYNVSKLWGTIRRELGALNAENKDRGTTNQFFDTKRKQIDYPRELLKPVRLKVYNQENPWAHLGKISYTRNTYQFHGPTADDHNAFGSNHMKKTFWFEEMRRRIIAEKSGISPEVDKSSLAGRGELYRVRDRAHKNPFYGGRRQPPAQQKQQKKDSDSDSEDDG